MVLKLFLAITLFLGPQAYSKSKRSSIQVIYKNSYIAYKKKYYRKSLRVLNKYFNFNSRKTPEKVLRLAALNYERMKRPLKAYKIYHFITKSKYNVFHQDIIKSYQVDSNADNLPDDIPKKLQEVYYRQLIIWSKFYKKEYDNNNLSKIKKLKIKIKMYAEILIELEHKDEKVEKLLLKIEKFHTFLKDRTYRSNYFLKTGFVSWKDIIKLVSNEGISTEIMSTTEGVDLCAGYKLENAHFIWKTSICYASTAADVGRKTEDLDYFQENVLIAMYSLVPALLWKPYHGDTAIGLSIPLVYRTGDYTSVPNYTIEDAQVSSYGYLLSFIWFFDAVSIQLDFGKLTKFSSSYWNLGLIYDF